MLNQLSNEQLIYLIEQLNHSLFLIGETCVDESKNHIDSDKAVNKMIDYINAFNFMPPRGDGAKELAIQEWKTCINDVIIQINNIKNTQIELLEKDK